MVAKFNEETVMNGFLEQLLEQLKADEKSKNYYEAWKSDNAALSINTVVNEDGIEEIDIYKPDAADYFAIDMQTLSEQLASEYGFYKMLSSGFDNTKGKYEKWFSNVGYSMMIDYDIFLEIKKITIFRTVPYDKRHYSGVFADGGIYKRYNKQDS